MLHSQVTLRYFDAVKNQEVSEGFTFANYLENFMPYADTELDKYNFAIRIKKEDYSSEEFEMNGYPVMIHTYTYESTNDAFNTEKPNYSNYIATVKLSDEVFVNVETVSALNTDEVKALVQKYVFDAMDL